MVTHHLYDGTDLVADYDAAGSLLRRIVHGPGVDEPLVWYEGTGTANKSWLYADHLGSIVARANTAGASTATYTYGPFGEPNDTTGMRFRYTGQQLVGALNLYHYKARFYSPSLGRFLQTDPIGYGDDLNLYAYVGNDPVNGVDPTGLARSELQHWGAEFKTSADAAFHTPGVQVSLAGGLLGSAGYVAGTSAAPLLGLGLEAHNLATSDVPVGAGSSFAAKGVGSFASDAKLLSHFEKHGAEFGARSADDYLQVGRDIMQSGQKVEYLYKGETRTGYVEFMGNTSRGDAKFGFVGTNADGAITTIHTQSGNSFWKLLNGNPSDKTIRPLP